MDRSPWLEKNASATLKNKLSKLSLWVAAQCVRDLFKSDIGSKLQRLAAVASPFG